MKKIYITLIVLLLVVAKTSFAQDGVFKFKKVEISFAEVESKDSLINLELYQNDVFITSDKNKNMGSRSMAKYDSLTGVYTLSYSYSGIGGGSDNRLGCPTLFVKLDFITKDKHKYFQLIPIVLPICGKTQLTDIKVLDINLNDLIGQSDKMIEVSENSTYQTVEKEGITLDKLVKIEKKSSFYK
ncbi:MAG: hypothetical protein ACI8XB_003014 [Patiriisocius sp.]|jgi:hypothetical protein